jgi:hypothetical protein
MMLISGWNTSLNRFGQNPDFALVRFKTQQFDGDYRLSVPYFNPNAELNLITGNL